jgi:hypothetical protein
MKPVFNYLDPDENAYVQNLLTLDEWDLEYVKLSDNVGYWSAPHPFKTDEDFNTFRYLIGSYPVCKSNNHEGCNDPNPFATIHLPTWISGPVVKLIRELFYKIYGDIPNDNPRLREWGNLYEKDIVKPVKRFRLPHRDGPNGLVCNMWFNDVDPLLSGTKLYEYKGKIINDYFDFQVDENHPRYKEWHDIDEGYREWGWVNFSDDEAEHWGFDCVGMAPSRYKGCTIYDVRTPHAPYIDNSIDWRWSHTFAYTFETPQISLGQLKF